MRFSKISYLSLMLLGSVVVGCGAGEVNTNQVKYYSAANNGYYLLESGVNPDNESELYLSIVDTSGKYIKQLPLVKSLGQQGSHYTFSNTSNNLSGTVTLKKNLLGISYTSQSLYWIDLATEESKIVDTLPNGTYNLICDQSNLSACNLVINNNEITLTEYSTTGQATVLCSQASTSKVSYNLNNPYLYTFTCGVDGGSSSGTWYLLPFKQNDEIAFMLNEFYPATNLNNNVTDEIAFLQKSINPNGTYNYLYNGGQSTGVGIDVASFVSAGLVNVISGSCGGSACAVNTDQYYNNNSLFGFAWYDVNLQANYNLTGSDKLGIYQDSFEGFYF